MSRIPTTAEMAELIEDRFAAATGEPREVTDIELVIVPEQPTITGKNWSCSLCCKRDYLFAWDEIYEEIQAAHPTLKFD